MEDFREQLQHGRDLAVAALGGTTKGAAFLSEIKPITKAALTNWKRVPVSWIVPVSRATNIPILVLRPDLAELLSEGFQQRLGNLLSQNTSKD
jgi:hypothetical protein